MPTSTGSWKKQESSRKTSISALKIMPKPLTMWITTNWKILKEMGIPDCLTCLLRNLYAGQEATVRTRHGKTVALTRWTFVGKVMSLLFNMLSRLVITFLPRSKCLLISWPQSPFALILEPSKIKSDTVSTVSTVSPSISMK